MALGPSRLNGGAFGFSSAISMLATRTDHAIIVTVNGTTTRCSLLDRASRADPTSSIPEEKNHKIAASTACSL